MIAVEKKNSSISYLTDWSQKIPWEMKMSIWSQLSQSRWYFCTFYFFLLGNKERWYLFPPLFTSFLVQLRRKEKHKGRKTKAYIKRSLSIPININDDIEVMISALQHIGLDWCEDTFTLHPFSFPIASQAKTCRKKGTTVKFRLSASQEK